MRTIHHIGAWCTNPTKTIKAPPPPPVTPSFFFLFPSSFPYHHSVYTHHYLIIYYYYLFTVLILLCSNVVVCNKKKKNPELINNLNFKRSHSAWSTGGHDSASDRAGGKRALRRWNGIGMDVDVVERVGTQALDLMMIILSSQHTLKTRGMTIQRRRLFRQF